MTTPWSILRFMPVLIKSQLFTSIPEVKSDISGQTIIVTGSNTGLGLEAARLLVKLNAAKVILAVRTVSKGEAAAADILASTRAKENVIEVWPFDLSDYASIKSFAERAQKLERLDGVIQNAGIFSNNFKLLPGSKTEAHIAVNVIGAVLLCLQLLPKLQETAAKFSTRTRFSFVGSDTMYVAKIVEVEGLRKEDSMLDALNDEKKADPGDRYPTSKQLLFYAMHAIASLLPASQSNVIINVMTPGACKSDLFRDETSWLGYQFQKLMVAIFARTTETGGRTLVDAVRPDLGVEAHGQFLMDCRVATMGSNMETEKGLALQKRFSDELFTKLEEIQPGVTKVLN